MQIQQPPNQQQPQVIHPQPTKKMEEPPKAIVCHPVEPADVYNVFRWDSPNWGWFFLGVIAGFLLTGLCGAMWRRIGGSPG